MKIKLVVLALILASIACSQSLGGTMPPTSSYIAPTTTLQPEILPNCAAYDFGYWTIQDKFILRMTEDEYEKFCLPIDIESIP